MSFHTKVAGVTFGNCQRVIRKLSNGQELLLIREPGNKFDKNAIKVMTLTGGQVGYISASIASSLAVQMDTGKKFSCLVSNITGGTAEFNYGVNIQINE